MKKKSKQSKIKNFHFNLFYNDVDIFDEFASNSITENSKNDNKNLFSTSSSDHRNLVCADTGADCDLLRENEGEDPLDQLDDRKANVHSAFGFSQQVKMDKSGDIRAHGQRLLSVGKYIQDLPGLNFSWRHDRYPIFYGDRGTHWPRLVCHVIKRTPYLRVDQYLLLRKAWQLHYRQTHESLEDFDSSALPNQSVSVKCTSIETNLSECSTECSTPNSSEPSSPRAIVSADNSPNIVQNFNSQIDSVVDVSTQSKPKKSDVLKLLHMTIKRLEQDEFDMDQRDWIRHDLNVFVVNTQDKFIELPDGGIELEAIPADPKANIRRHAHRTIPSEDVARGVLSVDLSGPHRRDRAGYCYFLVGAYTDLNGTRPCQPWVRILKTKNQHEVCHGILSIVNDINARNATKSVFRLHSDKGKEFQNAKVSEALNLLGCTQTTTGADDPASNGTSEVLVRKLKHSARQLLCQSGLDNKTFLWPYAVRHACYLLREPKKKSAKLPRFGSKVTVRIRHQKQNDITKDDFAPRGQSACYLGVCETLRPVGAFVRYESGKIDEVSHFIRDKSNDDAPIEPHDHAHDLAHTDGIFDLLQNSNDSSVDEETKIEEQHFKCRACRTGKGTHTKRQGCQHWNNVAPRRSPRLAKKQLLYNLLFTPIVDESALPESKHVDIPVRDMRKMQGQEKADWFEATMTEVNALLDRNVITRIQKGDPSIRNDPTIERLPSSVIYTLKAAACKGGRRRKKCRIVVCGNRSQTFGDVYTSTLDGHLARALLRLGAGKNWSFGSVDVKTAFLYADIPDDRRVLVLPPKFLIDLGVCQEDEVWILNKALYGLRESPRYWGQERDRKLSTLTFRVGKREYFLKQSCIDASLWNIRRKGSKDSEQSEGLLCTYVDDLLGTSESAILESLFSAVKTLWETTPPEFMHPGVPGKMRFLGVDLERRQCGGVFVSQERYVADILKKFGMDDCKGSDVLGDSDFEHLGPLVSPSDDPELFSKCQSALGAFIWLSTRTRCDIAYAVSRASQQLSKCAKTCWGQCKKIFKYLFKHNDLGLWMPKFENPADDVPPFESFSDASFAPTGNASQSGIILMWAGVPILWKSSRQTMIAQSTAESELIALASSLNISQGFSNVLHSVNVFIPPIKLLCDNKAAITNSEEGSSWRSRHYLIRAAALREARIKGLCHVHFVCSADQLADFLTKYLPAVTFARARTLCGMVSRSQKFS